MDPGSIDVADEVKGRLLENCLLLQGDNSSCSSQAFN